MMTDKVTARSLRADFFFTIIYFFDNDFILG